MNNKVRYAVIMAVSVLLNQVLSAVAMHFGWPLWLDFTGTALSAVVLEPTAGLLVGLIDNFYIAIFVTDNSSMLYYGASAAVAILAGVGMRKDGKLTLRRLPAVAALTVVIMTFLSTIMTMWRTGGVCSHPYEEALCQKALAHGVPTFFACMWGTFVVKVFDVITVSLLVMAIYWILPAKWKQNKEAAPGE